MLVVAAQLQPGHRSSKGYPPQMRLKGCLFQTVGQGCCHGNLSWIWHSWALGRSLASAWEAAGTQVPRPEQLPPLSDKERFVVFSLFPPNTHVNLPRPFHFSVSSLFSSPFFLLGLWSGIGFAGRMTEAGSAPRHRRGWGGGAPGPGPGLSTVLSVSLGLRHPWPGLALQSQSLAFSLDCPHGLSVRLAQSQQPGPLITKREGRLQIVVLSGYIPGHNGIMYLSTNHKGDLSVYSFHSVQ